jgi:hypothetical protein
LDRDRGHRNGEYVVAGLNRAEESLIASFLEAGLGVVVMRAFHLSWMEYHADMIFNAAED